MPIVAIVALIVAAAVLMREKGASAAPGAVDAKLKAHFEKCLTTGTAEELRKCAELAQKKGMPQTALALRKKAELVAKAPPPPIEGINAAAWTTFARKLKGPNAIRYGAYGVFAMSVRRLADLGLVKNVKRVRDPKTGKPVWTGTWVPPLSQQAYMSSLKTQYKAFAKSMSLYAALYRKARTARPGAFATAANGKPLTMSGFLALAHRAGGRGALAALSDPAKRFPQTWGFALKANGIF